MSDFQISMVQIEPNAVCNLRCWYCPHSQERRSVHGNMTVEQIHGIIDQCTPKSRVFHPGFNFVTGSYYNESLMYPHYEEFLDLLAEHNLVTHLLSNGTTISDEAADYLARHMVRGTITHCYFNIPSFDRTRWKKYTGGSDSTYDSMCEGLRLFLGKLSNELRKKCSIFVNVVDVAADAGTTQLLENSKNPTPEELKADFDSLWKGLGLDMSRSNPLQDRSGIMAERRVFTNQQLWPRPGTKVVGCRESEVYFRVDPAGDVILCCHDFRKRYVIGNVYQESIEQIWEGKRRAEVIAQARTDICRKCCGARTVPETKGQKVFVEIGAGRSDTLLHLANEGWSGVVVEPLPSNMDVLPKCQNVQYVQAAIAPTNGTETFYYFDPKALDEGKVPAWGYGGGTLDRNFVVRQNALGEHIRTMPIKTMTVRSLLETCKISRVDYLKIDAETYDAKILAAWPFDQITPEVVLYEHSFLDEDEKRKIIALLEAHGYRLTVEYPNIRAKRDGTLIGGKSCL